MSRHQPRGSQSRRGEPSIGVSVVKGTLVMLVLGTVCFVLGFFVLAPLMPRAATPDTTPPNRTPTPNDAVPATQNTQTPAQPVTPPPSPMVTPAPGGTSGSPTTPNSSPTIEPEERDRVQPPDNLDNRADGPRLDDTRPTPDSPEATTTPPAESRSRTGRNRRPSEPAPAPNPSEEERRPESRRTIEPPDTIGELPRTRDNARTARTQEPPAPRNPGETGLFRVQAGAFSTREKANEEAQRARDKGLDMHVRPIVRSGRTLYVVQHGIFRDRDRANTARQRLSDAGFDASVSPVEDRD